MPGGATVYLRPSGELFRLPVRAATAELANRVLALSEHGSLAKLAVLAQVQTILTEVQAKPSDFDVQDL